jgi:hypothetical protein
MTKTRTIRLTDTEVEALEELFKRLGFQGKQPGTYLNAGLRHLAATAAGAMAETVAAYEIAAGCAAGGDWYGLIEAVRPQTE